MTQIIVLGSDKSSEHLLCLFLHTLPLGDQVIDEGKLFFIVKYSN